MKKMFAFVSACALALSLVACSGGSAELGLKARPEEDAAIIAEALRTR